MARGRMISRSLGSSRGFHALLEAGGKLGEFCQVLFPLIVANTDDFGRMAGDAFTVKNVVLPSSKRQEPDFERALVVMHEIGLIVRYTVDGAIYLQVNKFDEHQTGLTKRTHSKFPAIPENAGTPVNLPLNLTEQNRTEQKGTEQNLDAASHAEGFDRFWAAYPKKKAKEDALKAWNKRRPDPALLSVMLRALARQQQSPDWQKDSGRYVPYPATWLNAGRWTDEADADLGDGLSDVTRYNLAASDEAERIILENDRRRQHGSH